MKKNLEKVALILCNLWYDCSIFFFFLMACAMIKGNKEEIWPVVIVLGVAGFFFVCKGIDDEPF